jgi:hypothetical protein
VTVFYIKSGFKVYLSLDEDIFYDHLSCGMVRYPRDTSVGSTYREMIYIVARLAHYYILDCKWSQFSKMEGDGPPPKSVTLYKELILYGASFVTSNKALNIQLEKILVRESFSLREMVTSNVSDNIECNLLETFLRLLETSQLKIQSGNPVVSKKDDRLSSGSVVSTQSELTVDTLLGKLKFITENDANRIVRLNEELRQSHLKEVNLQKDILNLKEELRQSHLKGVTLLKALTKTEEKCDSLNAELEKEREEKCASLNAELEKREEKCASLNAELEKCASLNAELEKREEKCASLNAELEKCREEKCASLNAELEKRDNQLESALKALTKSEDKLKALRLLFNQD